MNIKELRKKALIEESLLVLEEGTGKAPAMKKKQLLDLLMKCYHITRDLETDDVAGGAWANVTVMQLIEDVKNKL